MRPLGIPQLIIFPEISVNRQQTNRVPRGCQVAGWTCHPHQCLWEVWFVTSVKWQTLNAMDFELKTDKPILKMRMFICGNQDCRKITSEVDVPPSSTGLHIILPDE